MPINCPRGTQEMYRFKKGTNIRLGGCGKKGRFIKKGVKEVKNIKRLRPREHFRRLRSGKKILINKGKKVNIRGNKSATINKSPRKNKQLRATFNNGSYIDFGDPKMPEYPGTKRGDNYCARSSGLKNTDNVYSANFLSRRFLWNCKGKKSLRKRPKVL